MNEERQRQIRRVSRREVLGVLAAAVGVMLLTCIPYFIAMRPGFAGPDLHFAGFLWGVDDGNVYRMYLHQHTEGHLFSRDQFTIEPQNPRFVNLLFLALGQLSRFTGLSSILVYHLARVLGGIILLYLIYLLAAEITSSIRSRIMVFLLAAFSSGLGWIVYLGVTTGFLDPKLAESLSPIDVAAGWQAVPEGVTFLTLLLNPLFITGLALMCGAFLWGLRAARERGLRATLICGFLLLLLGNIHTYDVLVVYVVLLLWFGAQALTRSLTWPQATGRYALIVLLSLPTIAWQYYVQLADPIWAAKGAVPKTSPAPSGYLLGYGLVLLLAIVGAFYIVKYRKQWAAISPGGGRLPEAILPIIWLVVGFALVYSPLLFQRKLAEGLHIPLCLLAGIAVGQAWGARLSRSSFGLLAVGLVILTAPSNLYFVADCLSHLRVNNRDLAYVFLPPAYLTSDELAGVRWLADHTSPDDVVMCSSFMGNHIPPVAPCLVVAGHWDETIHFGHYLMQTILFYAPSSEVELKRRILQETGANWVFYGPEERLLQNLTESLSGLAAEPSLNPGKDLPELKPAFSPGEVTIYRVSTSPVR